MTRLFLDPGRLRQRGTLLVERPEARDDGGVETRLAPAGPVSLQVSPLRAEAGERFGQHEARVTHRVICRHRVDLRRGMVFDLGGRRLRILSVHDPDESRRYLLCHCREETP